MGPGQIAIQRDSELKLTQRPLRRARDMQDIGVDKMG
jgi:hypothetical protein